MKRAILACMLFALSAYASVGEPSLETRFSRERATLTCFEGPPSEPSCGGTRLAVYLSGEAVRHLDWTIETSTKVIRRQYYFDGGSPRLAVETIHAKLDMHAERLAKPRLLSTKHYRLDVPDPNARQKELLDHAQLLMNDFRKHQTDFLKAKAAPHE